MAKVEMLRELMTQRLAAVVEEICGLFETTIADYEENVSHLKKETEQQGRLLNAVLNNGVKLHSAGTQQVLVINKEQQECKSSLGHLHIKEEREELWSSQAGQFLEGSEKSALPVVLVEVFDEDTQQVVCPDEASSAQQIERQKDPGPPYIKEEQETSWRLDEEWRDHDEEKAHLGGAVEYREAESLASSSTQQMETDGDDYRETKAALQSDSEKTSNSSECETEDSDDEWRRTPRQQSNLNVEREALYTDGPGSEPARKVVPASGLKPASEYKTSDSSETEDSDDEDWKHSKKPQSSLPMVKAKEAPKRSSESSRQTFANSECGKSFGQKANLSKHIRSRSADKQLNSSVSKKSKDSKPLMRRKTKHVEEKFFPCSKCDKKFKKKGFLALHMKMHQVEHT